MPCRSTQTATASGRVAACSRIECMSAAGGATAGLATGTAISSIDMLELHANPFVTCSGEPWRSERRQIRDRRSDVAEVFFVEILFGYAHTEFLLDVRDEQNEAQGVQQSRAEQRLIGCRD